jgi:hypothetical protein
VGLTVTASKYEWAIERNGFFVLSEYDLHGGHHTLKEAPPTPYKFHARTANGRCFTVEIEDGQTPIWEHRTTDSVSMFNGARVVRDSIIFGCREADGKETVLRVYPDGQSFEFTSLNAARGYTRI